MKHRSGERIRYGAVSGMAGLETLSAERLQAQFDRHFHDSYSFGIVLDGVERCSLGRELNIYESGAVPMFNPGEVHDGGPATEGGWSYRMVYIDPSLVPGERVFPRPARRDALAQRRVLQLFDAIDCGSLLGVDETLHLALATLAMSEQLLHYQRKLQFEIDSWDLKVAREAGEAITVVDARSRQAFAREHIPGAISLPHREMTPETTSGIDKRTLVVVYCDGIGCNGSTKGALKMTELGFRTRELIGGLDWWKRDGHPTSK